VTRFWFATFAVGAAGPGSEAPPLLPTGTRHLAVEVLQDGDEWAVLVSSTDHPENPQVLTCHLGFTNMAKACNVWLDRGFPLMDSLITMPAPGELRVASPFFGSQHVMQYEKLLLELSGVDLDLPSAPPSTLPDDGALAPSYHQHLQVPDSAQPNEFVAKEPVSWAALRREVRSLDGKQVRFNPGASFSRSPALAEFGTTSLTPLKVWSG